MKDTRWHDHRSQVFAFRSTDFLSQTTWTYYEIVHVHSSSTIPTFAQVRAFRTASASPTDVAATLLNLHGVMPPTEADSRSLLRDSHRDAVIFGCLAVR